ncbi:MAG TPA: phenylalanine--tRNA ligase subunit alpha [Acidimicrobiia bacterium]
MNLPEHLAVAEVTIQAARTVADLDEVEKKLLGRNSPIGEARRGLGKLDPSERPAAGAEVNRVSAEISGLLAQKRAELERATADLLLVNDSVDVTVERWTLSQGTEHLVQQTIDEVCNIFIGLGYRVEQGPEAELAWFNFDALNTPPHHPSRFESDTLYLDFGDPADEVLLRTHTSPMQVRYMQSQKPPLYVVVPGKTFRSDTIDASHLPVFHQIEGLAVDSGIVFSDLKGTLAHFAREFFGREQRIRLRPSFFPFTEPSAELDVSCFVCGGAAASCRLCGGSGWLEMAGCGMVDPNVLDMAGHDSQTLSGFAFGMGVERLAMVRHGISNIRVFIDNDLRALRQFR